MEAEADRDLYADLEIKPTADANEIKRQFKKLALKYHPDRNPGKELEYNSKFQAIQSANEILTDPQQRAKYDAARMRAGLLYNYTNSSSKPNVPPRPTATGFPPPPRPPPAPAPKSQYPPWPSGAQKYGRFDRPGSTSTWSTSGNEYKAWDQMRHGHPTRTVPPKAKVPKSATAAFQAGRVPNGAVPRSSSGGRSDWDRFQEGHPGVSRANPTATGFPPPPRPPPAPAPKSQYPPWPSGAQKYGRFDRPGSTSTWSTSGNEYKAWDQMRHGHPTRTVPPKAKVPKSATAAFQAGRVPNGAVPRSSSGGRSDWDRFQEGHPGVSRANTSRVSPKRAGFAPGTPGEDERQAPQPRDGYNIYPPAPPNGCSKEPVPHAEVTNRHRATVEDVENEDEQSPQTLSSGVFGSRSDPPTEVAKLPAIPRFPLTPAEPIPAACEKFSRELDDYIKVWNIFVTTMTQIFGAKNKWLDPEDEGYDTYMKYLEDFKGAYDSHAVNMKGLEYTRQVVLDLNEAGGELAE